MERFWLHASKICSLELLMIHILLLLRDCCPSHTDDDFQEMLKTCQFDIFWETPKKMQLTSARC